MADWYVYQHDGEPLGPWSTDKVAEEILAGRLTPDCWVAAPGGPRWLRALDVPSIARLVEGIPTRPRRRDSGLRLMPGVVPTGEQPRFGGTMMMVKDEEIIPSSNVMPTLASAMPESSTPEPHPTTRRSDVPSSEDAPPTDRDVSPASSSQPTGQRTRRTKNA
ncbi:MAG: DUF4339 domain-containing protein [Deltaproteobacteria bacterium]|nr:DUF4339 domain-containing protein [Deltaproteobacteria bacterium]